MRRFLLASALMLLPANSGLAQALRLDSVGTTESRSGQGTAENAQATFRSGVDLVTVSATVRDNKGRLVKDLTKRDFEVVDRGERRSISEFRSDRAPMSLAILFDVSGSMDVADRTNAAKFAAHHLISGLEAGRDEAGLIGA